MKTHFKIQFIDFQRNGIGGIGFYTIYARWHDPKEFDRPFDMIITAEPTDDSCEKNGTYLKYDQCRVITPAEPRMNWRGDRLCGELNTALQELANKKGVERGLLDLCFKTFARDTKPDVTPKITYEVHASKRI